MKGPAIPPWENPGSSSWHFTGVVLAHLASKSNGRRKTGDGRVIKSEQALEFEDAFSAQIPPAATPYEGPVKLTVRAYYPNRRRDLDVSLLQDCIQKAGIIRNDRQIEKVDAERWLHRLGQPRVEFEVEPWTPKVVEDPPASSRPAADAADAQCSSSRTTASAAGVKKRRSRKGAQLPGKA